MLDKSLVWIYIYICRQRRKILDFRIMKQLPIILSLGLLLGLGTAKAQVQTQALGVELGSHNTALYELALGQRFSITARAGLVLDAGYSFQGDVNNKHFYWGGLTPFINLEPRLYFSRKSSSNLFHSGGYVGLRFDTAWDAGTIVSPFNKKEGDQPQYTTSFTPNLGWVFRIKDNSYLRFSAGIGFFRTKVAYQSERYYWRTNKTQGFTPIGLEMVYGIRF